jgi:hypothetical protein
LHFLVHSTSVPDELLEDELEEEDELLLEDELPPEDPDEPPEELDPVPLEEVVPEELVVVPLDVVVPLELVVVPLDELVMSPEELVVPLDEVSPLEVEVSPLEEPVPDEELVLELLEELLSPDEEDPPELLLATAWVERSFAVFSKEVSSAVPSCVSPTIAAIPTTAAMSAYSTEVTPSSAVKKRSMLMQPGWPELR